MDVLDEGLRVFLELLSSSLLVLVLDFVLEVCQNALGPFWLCFRGHFFFLFAFF